MEVEVFRTVERGNAVPTLMGAFFGVSGSTSPPLRRPRRARQRDDVREAVHDSRQVEGKEQPGESATFDKYDNKNNLLPDADVYHDAMQSNYTGYTTENDAGTSLTLRAGTGDEVEPELLLLLEDAGGYRWRFLSRQHRELQSVGDALERSDHPGAGDKTGPTIQGIQALIDKDPNARWDTTCKCVKDSAFAISPRVFPIPLYDPEFYADGKANGRVADFRIANFLGFFADAADGQQDPRNHHPDCRPSR